MIVNWVAFCVGLHLNNDLSQAWSAVQSINNIVKNDQNNKLKAVEENEFKLYQVMLLIQLRDFEHALSLLAAKDSITDELALNEYYVEIYRKNGNPDLA
jgi:hypothetical protein